MIYWCSWGDGSVLQQLPEHVLTAYVLVLNPMRGRTEEQRMLAASENREELLAAWRGEEVQPYTDGEWRRVYRKGGPLEWFNPPFSDGDADHYGNGIIEMRRDGWRRAA
jgi:hypothetical protein